MLVFVSSLIVALTSNFGLWQWENALLCPIVALTDWQLEQVQQLPQNCSCCALASISGSHFAQKVP